MGSTTRVIRMEEVKQHNKDKDCWIVIHDNVYDVSQFLEEHPGGDFTILEHAGAFATEAFEDVGHSESARDLMKKYHVGVLAEEDKESTLKFSSNYSREKMASFT
ncbi:unnamed protein product [Mesocestoides corti]|uniref:Cytochrome b5 heme-binding domain-containing protein n=1 Tax=Mesocestoides corti TaxID=53468 RepID=A0A0R3UMI7_MESCO|nr:unnamed protein product [Mesocestoides corti]